MNLRVKTLSLVIATLVISAAVLLYVASSVTRDSYGALERQSANRDLQRLETVFLAEFKRMFALLEDYASWDDTYDFALTRSAEYVESNLSGDTFSNLGINVFIMVDRQGTELHSSAHDMDEGLAGKTIKHLLSELSPGEELFEDHPKEFGLIMIDQKTMLIAMAPILRSDDSGTSRGIALVGRYLDRDKLEELQLKTQLKIAFETVGETKSSNNLSSLIAELQKQSQSDALTLESMPSALKIQDDQTMMGHILIPDISGEPLLIWSVSIPRDIHQEGNKSLSLLLIVMGIIGLVVVICVVVLLEWLVLRRVARLNGEVMKIGETDDLSARVGSQGSDELGSLASSVNGMLEQLQISKGKLEAEHERAEDLLLNILPASIAEQLKNSHKQIANSHDEVSVLFADLVGFTELSTEMSAADLVSMLNDIFSQFDDLTDEFELEKIKTIGDAYMVVAGLPEAREDHAEIIAKMALHMVAAIEKYSKTSKLPVKIRIGINSGQVVAGVIGKKKFIYDLWGDTVNIASRMESSGETGMIQVTEATYEKIRHAYDLEHRGVIDIKGRGEMTTYVLKGAKSE